MDRLFSRFSRRRQGGRSGPSAVLQLAGGRAERLSGGRIRFRSGAITAEMIKAGATTTGVTGHSPSPRARRERSGLQLSSGQSALQGTGAGTRRGAGPAWTGHGAGREWVTRRTSPLSSTSIALANCGLSVLVPLSFPLNIFTLPPSSENHYVRDLWTVEKTSFHRHKPTCP
jgi:hypothetical protein